MPLTHCCTIDGAGRRAWPEWSDARQAYVDPAGGGDDGDAAAPVVFVLHPQLDAEHWAVWPDLDRTALRQRPLGGPSLPALLARVVAPDTTVFAVLPELGQPFGFANGKALQVLLHFWCYCARVAAGQHAGGGNAEAWWAATTHAPPGLPVALPHDGTAVWWEGQMLVVQRWPRAQHAALRAACAALLLRLGQLSPTARFAAPHLAPPPPFPPCGGEHVYPSPVVEAEQLCLHCLHALTYEAHIHLGPLSLDPGLCRLHLPRDG